MTLKRMSVNFKIDPILTGESVNQFCQFNAPYHNVFSKQTALPKEVRARKLRTRATLFPCGQSRSYTLTTEALHRAGGGYDPKFRGLLSILLRA